MSVVNFVELSAQSPQSYEDAVPKRWNAQRTIATSARSGSRSSRPSSRMWASSGVSSPARNKGRHANMRDLHGQRVHLLAGRESIPFGL
jgi:hypothetical protein